MSNIARPITPEDLQFREYVLNRLANVQSGFENIYYGSMPFDFNRLELETNFEWYDALLQPIAYIGPETVGAHYFTVSYLEQYIAERVVQQVLVEMAVAKQRYGMSRVWKVEVKPSYLHSVVARLTYEEMLKARDMLQQTYPATKLIWEANKEYLEVIP